MVLAHGGQGEWNRLGSSGKEEITRGRPPPALAPAPPPAPPAPPALADRQAGRETMGRCGDPGFGWGLLPTLITIQRINQVDNSSKNKDYKIKLLAPQGTLE